jgi:hypothetical protein
MPRDRVLPDIRATVIHGTVKTTVIVVVDAIVRSIWPRSALNMVRARSLREVAAQIN